MLALLDEPREPVVAFVPLGLYAPRGPLARFEGDSDFEGELVRFEGESLRAVTLVRGPVRVGGLPGVAGLSLGFVGAMVICERP